MLRPVIERAKQRSFNRYMVECESLHHAWSLLLRLRFNRYMVECECVNMAHILAAVHGFNRYMVECEYGLLSKGATDDDVLIDTWWNVN